MGATERIVIHVTTVQKKAIAANAKRLGLNVSELIREAARGFAPSDDEQQIDALIDRVTVSAKKASDAIDDALSFVAESNKRIAKMMEENR